MVWSPLLEVGKYHAPPTPQPPIVIGSPRYYQVTGLKPPKSTKTQPEQTAPNTDKFDDTMSIDSLEKPILNQKPPKSNRLAKALGLKK
ncbi:hypothetical protein CONLIGDRAFT_637089 [Coniochaeta ligniaria NRRL 30616]|uniref:Uncharacterized protein n=1 Tax=Coniochaeta ligniaria NRRL 30616 TaxID=1408157 RepID=A0A1J7I874_9PEZI|nr:hypothetical protein CONLIGDRAFT_637089 [Coniochaeta ligniaria NRRL 30616]